MAGCGCGGYGSNSNQHMHMMNMPAQYNPMMTMPEQYSPMMTMPQEDLEMMYPQVYYIIHPAVMGYCDMAGIKHGMMFTPTRQQVDSMVDGIYRSVEGQLGPEEDMMGNMEARQPFTGFGPGLGFGFGRRRFFRDLIGILLIRELLRRRHGFGGY